MSEVCLWIPGLDLVISGAKLLGEGMMAILATWKSWEILSEVLTESTGGESSR